MFLIYKVGVARALSSFKPYIELLSLLSLLTLAVNLDFSIKYFYEIMLFLTCSAIVLLLSFENFKLVYSDIIFFISLFSIIIHFLNIFTPGLLSVFPIYRNETGYPFRFCFLGVATEPDFGLYRNWGLFREPGVFIFYLCIGLIFELFNKNINFKRVICYIVSIVTTLSTAGFIVTGLIFCVFFLFSKKATQKQRLIFTFFLLLGIGLSVSIGIASNLIDSAFGKLYYENDSTTSRIGSIMTNFNMWCESIKSILFGNGFSFVEQNFSHYVDATMGGWNNTNTAFKMLAVHGLFYTSIVYYMLIKFCRKEYKSISLFIFIIIILLQSNEDLIVSFHTYLFAYYALGKKTKSLYI